MTRTNPNAVNPDKWKGQNLLGICLMNARKVIKMQS
jgi:predicted NAD-dependent protein-ADP-ribosyltransferase YbiA (DUF1768 family)